MDPEAWWNLRLPCSEYSLNLGAFFHFSRRSKYRTRSVDIVIGKDKNKQRKRKGKTKRRVNKQRHINLAVWIHTLCDSSLPSLELRCKIHVVVRTQVLSRGRYIQERNLGQTLFM